MQELNEIRATGRPSPEQRTETGQHMSEDRAKEATEIVIETTSSPGRTPCPACTLVIDISVTHCPHCSSNVSADMALLREKARQQRDSLPLWKKIAGYFSDPSARRDLRFVAPALVILFGVAAALRFAAEPLVFWIAAPLAGLLTHLLLKRLRVERTIKVDLYRTVLVIGLLALLGSALF